MDSRDEVVDEAQHLGGKTETLEDLLDLGRVEEAVEETIHNHGHGNQGITGNIEHGREDDGHILENTIQKLSESAAEGVQDAAEEGQVADEGKTAAGSSEDGAEQGQLPEEVADKGQGEGRDGGHQSDQEQGTHLKIFFYLEEERKVTLGEMSRSGG